MKGVLTDEPRSSGAMLLNLWVALRDIVGQAAYDQGMAAISDEARDEIKNAQAISWVRMRSSYALVEASAVAAGRDPDAVYDEAVKRCVVLTYRGVWKILLRLSSPDALLTRASLLYSKSRNWGKMSAFLHGDGRAELRVTEWPQMPDRYIRSIALSSVGILELTGQRQAEYTYTPTRDGAIIRIRWGEALREKR